MDREVLYIYVYMCVCTHTLWNISHKKGWNDAISSHMDGPRDYHIKWSQTEKRNIIWYHLYVESLKSDTNELIYKTEIDSQT